MRSKIISSVLLAAAMVFGAQAFAATPTTAPAKKDVKHAEHHAKHVKHHARKEARHTKHHAKKKAEAAKK